MFNANITIRTAVIKHEEIRFIVIDYFDYFDYNIGNLVTTIDGQVIDNQETIDKINSVLVGCKIRDRGENECECRIESNKIDNGIDDKFRGKGEIIKEYNGNYNCNTNNNNNCIKIIKPAKPAKSIIGFVGHLRSE